MKNEGKGATGVREGERQPSEVCGEGREGEEAEMGAVREHTKRGEASACRQLIECH